MPFISSVRGSFGPQSKSKRNINQNMLDSISGGSITTAGGYRIHTYTTPGAATFVNSPGVSVEILMVAGGGGGGSIGGGGGAGGYIYGTANFGGGTFPLNIASGGSGSSSGHGSGVVGTQGGNSTGFGLTAIGGGFGCGWASWSGNSGQGGSTGGGTGPTASSAALQPSQPAVAGITQVGHRGADGGALTDEVGMTGSPDHQGGGGGGAGDRGIGRGGGLGLYSSITGSSVGRGGGGGGGVHTSAANNQWSPSYSTVGIPFGGGVGAGQNDQNPSGKNGVANTGGGGGGMHHGSDYPTGAGGSGIIVIRYPSNPNSVSV
jgi:hypothetical protein